MPSTAPPWWSAPSYHICLLCACATLQARGVCYTSPFCPNITSFFFIRQGHRGARQPANAPQRGRAPACRRPSSNSGGCAPQLGVEPTERKPSYARSAKQTLLVAEKFLSPYLCNRSSRVELPTWLAFCNGCHLGLQIMQGHTCLYFRACTGLLFCVWNDKLYLFLYTELGKGKKEESQPKFGRPVVRERWYPSTAFFSFFFLSCSTLDLIRRAAGENESKSQTQCAHGHWPVTSASRQWRIRKGAFGENFWVSRQYLIRCWESFSNTNYKTNFRTHLEIARRIFWGFDRIISTCGLL